MSEGSKALFQGLVGPIEAYWGLKAPNQPMAACSLRFAPGCYLEERQVTGAKATSASHGFKLADPEIYQGFGGYPSTLRLGENERMQYGRRLEPIGAP